MTSEHHPHCYQNTGVPEDLPSDLCDCRVLRAIERSSGESLTEAEIEMLNFAISDADGLYGDPEDLYAVVERLKRTWQAEALREAADLMEEFEPFPGEEPDWLRHRAIALEGER